MNRFAVALALAGSLYLSLTACTAVPESTGTVAASDSAELDRRGAVWRGCLAKSYAAQRATTRDRSLAAETAFQACATEEKSALEYTVAQSGPMDPAQVSQLIADGKAKLKAELIAGRPPSKSLRE